ncbi:hypothetical protein TRIUR3_02046 [Triticum urartu]|uniref:Uncharacterized protein n=1 Tax=Triticum urartu TaxID=4572 RepID=M8ASL4_TRIUA|nr:hypothetical protein TRIUR3_02046 [Triticum urartu]
MKQRLSEIQSDVQDTESLVWPPTWRCVLKHVVCGFKLPGGHRGIMAKQEVGDEEPALVQADMVEHPWRCGRSCSRGRMEKP